MLKQNVNKVLYFVIPLRLMKKYYNYIHFIVDV